jgi:hypothetical protein
MTTDTKRPVWIATADDAWAQQIIDILGTTGRRVQRVNAAMLQSSTVADETVVIADLAAPSVPQDTLSSLCRRARTLALTSKDGPTTLDLLASHPGLNHVLVKNNQLRPRQITSIVSKLAGTPLWGIESYLAPGSACHRQKIKDYAKKQDVIDGVRAYTEELASFRELPNLAATVTWELMMNGFFDAPLDRESGVPKYADKPRHEGLILADHEAIDLAYGHDDDLFVVSVTDPFGRLDRATVLGNLQRSAQLNDGQIKRTSAGAGVGLFIVFDGTSQLDVHVAPGSRTEVTAVICLSRRLKDFEQRGNSLNFFFDEAG